MRKAKAPDPTEAEIAAMEREQEREIHEAHQELGRRVMAAVLSYHLGDSLSATYKTLKGKEIAESWVRVGQEMQRSMVNNMFAGLDLKLPELPTTEEAG